MGDSITKFEEMQKEIPTLEQVKEHFKNAKEVRCLQDLRIYDIEHIKTKLNADIEQERLAPEEFWINDILLWDRKYAEIISYKDAEVLVDKNEIQKSLKKINNFVHKPQRYASREVNGMDVIDLVKHWNLNFNEGNILKYLLRDKGQDISDLEKIIDYAQREIKHKKTLL